MDFTNFLTPEALVTFTMTLVIVELWVGFTKGFPIIKKIPTKIYTFILAIIHLVVINSGLGTLEVTVLGIYTLLCNSLIISILLCGGYDVMIGKILVQKSDDGGQE